MLSKQKKEQKRTVRKYQTQISQERNVNEQLVEKVKEQIDEKVKYLIVDHDIFWLGYNTWYFMIQLLHELYLCIQQRIQDAKDKLRQVSHIVNGREGRSRTRGSTRVQALETTMSTSGIAMSI